MSFASQDGLTQSFLENLRLLFVAGRESAPAGPQGNALHAGTFGLAVSGGGDSIAMLHLAVDAGLKVEAVTVDHGLRPEATQEAAMVGRLCAELNVPHQVLQWRWDGSGNLQDAARRGRRELMAGWARRRNLSAVLMAHTQDDVAETFLMRLARGAGVDGLAAMTPAWREGRVLWLRPLLSVSRLELRSYLGRKGATWAEDPSNVNDRYERAKARKALARLHPLGLGSRRLAEVAGHLAEARDALETLTKGLCQAVLRDHGVALQIETEMLAAYPREIQRRVLLLVIRKIAPPQYAPRGAALDRLLVRLLGGGEGVLGGCRFQRLASGLWAYREAKAVADLVALPWDIWDGRWKIEMAEGGTPENAGSFPDGAELRALGAPGLALCPQWRDSGLPRGALLSSPGLWQGERLVAAPQALFGAESFRLSGLNPA